MREDDNHTLKTVFLVYFYPTKFIPIEPNDSPCTATLWLTYTDANDCLYTADVDKVVGIESKN